MQPEEPPLTPALVRVRLGPARPGQPASAKRAVPAPGQASSAALPPASAARSTATASPAPSQSKLASLRRWKLVNGGPLVPEVSDGEIAARIQISYVRRAGHPDLQGKPLGLHPGALHPDRYRSQTTTRPRSTRTRWFEPDHDPDAT